MVADWRPLSQRLASLERDARAGSLRPGAGRELAERIIASELIARRRRDLVPTIHYPPELPISQRKDDIRAAIEQHQVVVVCGETGSGKSTQLPKLLLEMGRGVRGMIGHTQPRRIAARSVSARLAEELGVELGGVVGYKVRFGDKTTDRTLIKVVTDGMLLAETQTDQLLERYDTIIIDEAHERSLNIDFLLGMLRRILPKRPDLKLVITSATIDPDRFARHFSGFGESRDPAPVILVSGRTYPVQIRYKHNDALLDADAADEDDRDDSQEHEVVDAVNELAKEGPGDILVFLAGEREIRETADLLSESQIIGWSGREQIDVLPLFARLSAEDQMKVFKRSRSETRRRVVLSTNVAETSVTVPGIAFVIDTGLVRLSRYSTRTKTLRLPIEPVSQASANQRAGRCGRTGPGICIRLYAQEDFDKSPPFTEPEILRTNLASVILQMKALRLGEPRSFPFVERPDGRLIADGYETLLELGAVEEDKAGEFQLTHLGRAMARLPVDPRIARIILAGFEERCPSEMLLIAAALSVQDPRERNIDTAQKADEAHAVFRDPDSDFLSFLRLWAIFKDQSNKLGGSALRRWCKAAHLSYVRLREWQDVHRQLSEMLAEIKPVATRAESAPRLPNIRGWKGGGTSEPTYEQIHCALLAGLLSSIGTKHETFEYDGTRGSRFNIHPGSALYKAAPKWIMASELVRTTKLYARCVAKIKPEWVERIGATVNLLKRSHRDPNYDEASQRVMALEKITLLGLELVASRRVHYGPLHPPEARSIFIQSALVDGLFTTPGRFLAHNAEVFARVKTIEHKLRRNDILAGPQQRYDFYETRLSHEVYSGQSFERWRQDIEKKTPRLLFMTEQDAMAAQPGADALAKFPDHLEDRGTRLELRYRAEPGKPDDGVTAVIPVEALNRVDPAAGEYLVPGMLVDKIEAIIKTLPKSLRTAFVPAKQYADLCAAELAPRGNAPSREPLVDAVARILSGLSETQIKPADFRATELPEYLRLNYAVVDRAGKQIATGRELTPLRRELASVIDAHLRSLPPTKPAAGAPAAAFNRTGITRWDVGDLPAEAEMKHGAVQISGFPVLIDEGSTVSLRLMASKAAAAEAHFLGVRRLFTLVAHRAFAAALQRIKDWNRLAVLYGPLGTTAALKQGLIDRAAEAVFLTGPADAVATTTIRTQSEFEARFRAGESAIDSAVQQVAATTLAILNAAQAAGTALADAIRSPNPFITPNLADARQHLGRLIVPRFLSTIPAAAFPDYPRYLQAIEVRVRRLIEKGAVIAPRDDQHAAIAAEWWSKYIRQHETNLGRREPDPHLELLRWMIEELRVSLFAQELGTKYPISEQRLAKQWDKCAK